MARKTIFVSDLSSKTIEDGNAVKITVSFADARRGRYVIDAHPDDIEVKKLIDAGTKQGRRGRRAKAQ